MKTIPHWMRYAWAARKLIVLALAAIVVITVLILALQPHPSKFARTLTNLLVLSAIVSGLTAVSRQRAQPPPMICPNSNCGYRGPAKRVARGSDLLLLVLLCLWIIPGVIYLICRSGYRTSCPQCGIQIASDN